MQLQVHVFIRQNISPIYLLQVFCNTAMVVTLCYIRHKLKVVQSRQSLVQTKFNLYVHSAVRKALWLIVREKHYAVHLFGST